jgi:argininosuccinate synthase
MRNLDIADSRAKLEQYAVQTGGQLSRAYLLRELAEGGLASGGAEQIAANPSHERSVVGDATALDAVAMEFGSD